MSAVPSPEAIIIAETLTRIAKVLQAAIFLAVASLIVMVFDTIITIDQELKFVWRQRWSFGKAMFIFIRHGSTLLMLGHVTSMLLHNPSIELCRTIEKMFVWSQVVIMLAGSSVLIVRTWLLCGGSKWILAALVLGLIGITVPCLYFVAEEVSGFIVVPNPAPALLPGCLVPIPTNAWRLFVFPLAYETLILGITFIKASTMHSRTPVLMRLLRDGTLYYVAVVAVLIVTTIGATNNATRGIVVGSGYHIASISIGCSRLFLSLHSWSEAYNLSKISTSNPSARHSSVLNRKGSHSHPTTTTQDYELTVRTNSDIESTKWNAGDVVAPTAPYKVNEFQSVLPDIERPSLPERMWSTLPGPHSRHQQHHIRPPRSSSLYATGQVPNKPLLRAPTVPVVEEPDEAEWAPGSGFYEEREVGTFVSGKRYNVV